MEKRQTIFEYNHIRILKLNNDYIILNVKGEGRVYLYSQKMLDELHKRAAEKE